MFSTRVKGWIAGTAAILGFVALGACMPDDAPTEPTAVEATTEPAAKNPPASPEKATPSLTAAQTNALAHAHDYLSYSPFSRSGLIKQMEFEGYVRADAVWAVNHLSVSWREQAARHAAQYLEYSPFSRQGLIDQLVFEGYTPAQAEHGADKAGL